MDLVVRLSLAERQYPVVVHVDPDSLSERARLLGESLVLRDSSDDITTAAGEISIVPMAIDGKTLPGQPRVEHVEGVLAQLDAAIEGCLSARYGGLVTGPMQKSIVNEAGIVFRGHTEYLMQKAQVEDVVMLLVAGTLRVALATTHVPLRQVADELTPEMLRSKLSILNRGLQSRFKLDAPRIAVAGLNPHAGEGGHLGREELDVITPVVEAMADKLDLEGPFPADTLFTPAVLSRFDAVLSMFHDQGLPVLKYAGFGEAVNVTLGLPFVRTSVDHGTALDIAGTDRVHAGSFRAAVRLAVDMAGP